MTNKLTLTSIEQHIKNLELSEALEYLNKLKSDNCSLKLDKISEKYNKKYSNYLKEVARYNKIYEFEKEAFKKGFEFVAGVDEAGRGPLAGPVVAAAVILPKNSFIEGIDDSKKLSPQKRKSLYDVITNKALSFGVGIISEKEIDKINILNATKQSMLSAIDLLNPCPHYVLIDALELKSLQYPQLPLIKGDARSVTIAAASIIAKVTRDEMMSKFHALYPQYNFEKNKGYGTKEHIESIKKYGPCPIHRLSFIQKFI